MIVCLWSLKGGAGCSVAAALLALDRAGPQDGGAVLVDLGGDLPAVLGCQHPDEVGVAEWLDRGVSGDPAALARLAIDIGSNVRLIGRGRAELPTTDPDDALFAQLDALPGIVIVDAGSVIGSSPRATTARWLAARSTRSVLVTRACYLALSRAGSAPVAPSGVLLVREPGRSFRREDVEAALGSPVLAELAYDPAISRAVDAGLLRSRRPRGLQRVLGAVT